MYRLAIYFDGAAAEAAALQDRVAALMRDRARCAPNLERSGYVVTLVRVADPPDDDAFVTLVSADAERILLGPRELLDPACP